MKKVVFFSVLLVAGLALSQFLPTMVGDAYGPVEHVVRMLTMMALAFIMINVGREFEIDKSRLGMYGWDYLIAMTTAAFPWIFVTLYFVFAMLPAEFWGDINAWKESLLAGRFAAPTSAGVLFAMLAAAGLSMTWMFHKARVLAIFDDLDTVLLMLPLKALMVGLVWQLGVIFVVTLGLLWLAWVYLHRWRIPTAWPWVLGYAAAIMGLSEVIYFFSLNIDDTMGIHIEVLLPAFVLGCLMAHDENPDKHEASRAVSAKQISTRIPEERVTTIISAAFMVLVGLSMPSLLVPEEVDLAELDLAELELAEEPFADESVLQFAQPRPDGEIASYDDPASEANSVIASQPFPGWDRIAVHVVMLTLLANLGKMIPLFCYQREAHWKERLALAVGMWPRGEVGAGVLVVSLSYGIGGPILTAAMLSLCLNLVLTGFFIVIVKRLLESSNADILSTAAIR